MAKQESDSDLCRCCHSEGSHKDLYASYFWLDKEEVVYFNLLQECFDIKMLPVTEALQHMLCAICNNCIERLHEALKFKRQVLKCEKRFREVYGMCAGEGSKSDLCIEIDGKPTASGAVGQTTEIDVTYDVQVKQEIDMDITDETIGGSNANCSGQMSKDPGPSKMEREFNSLMDDDDELSDRGDDFLLTPVASAVFIDESNPKNTTTSASKVKSKVKPVKPKGNRKGVKQKLDDAASSKEDVEENCEGGGESEEKLENVDDDSKTAKHQIMRLNVHYKETEKGYQCLMCPVVVDKTTSKNKITMHVKGVHFKTAKYLCTICSEGFWTIRRFLKHKLDKHNIDERFKCNACDRSFNHKVSLKNHTQIFHMLGDKWECKKCDYVTYKKAYLTKHMVCHSKSSKKFQCQYCQKLFRRKNALGFHERIHTGDKRKLCSECGQQFVQRASLKYHMLKHHPGVEF